jgi:hypothetical protein
MVIIGKVFFEYCATSNMSANLLTKGLPRHATTRTKKKLTKGECWYIVKFNKEIVVI